MPDLEAAYRKAQEKFAKSPTDANKHAYKSAKQAFADERTAQKQAEEADPNHPRGTGLANVSE